MSRPSWDDTWLEVANAVAKRSLCVRAQVGAVIVDPTNRIVATGYNGPPRDYPRPMRIGVNEATCDHWCTRGQEGPTDKTAQSYVDCPSLHAEVNALSVCDRVAREGGQLYVTDHICFGCAKVVANAGLRRIVVASNHEAAHRNVAQSYHLLKSCGIEVDVRDKGRQWP